MINGGILTNPIQNTLHRNKHYSTVLQLLSTNLNSTISYRMSVCVNGISPHGVFQFTVSVKLLLEALSWPGVTPSCLSPAHSPASISTRMPPSSACPATTAQCTSSLQRTPRGTNSRGLSLDVKCLLSLLPQLLLQSNTFFTPLRKLSLMLSWLEFSPNDLIEQLHFYTPLGLVWWLFLQVTCESCFLLPHWQLWINICS